MAHLSPGRAAAGVSLCCVADIQDHRAAPMVLIVDQDAAVRDALAVSLTAGGFDVLAFQSAGHFLTTLPIDRQGCLLVELDLKDMMGTELVEKLIERRIEMPAVIMSARLRNPALERRLPPGIVSFLQKPFGQEELMARIKLALDCLT